jgi:hypothetical protein
VPEPAELQTNTNVPPNLFQCCCMIQCGYCDVRPINKHTQVDAFCAQEGIASLSP